MINIVFLIINVVCATTLASRLSDNSTTSRGTDGFFLCLALVNIDHFARALA